MPRQSVGDATRCSTTTSPSTSCLSPICHHGYGGTLICRITRWPWLTERLQVLAPSNSSTAAAVTFITFVQDLKRKTKTWGPMIELCASGEKTLERFRYQFPDDWLYSDQLRGEWSAYNEILKRKNDSIQEQLGECHYRVSGMPTECLRQRACNSRLLRRTRSSRTR